MTILVACGLKREGCLIQRSNPAIVWEAGGGDATRLRSGLVASEVASGPFAMILSSGLAGALDPRLTIGSVVIDGDPPLVARLAAVLPGAIVAPIVGSDTIVATASEKQALRTRTGAAAADMESQVAACFAAERNTPFAAIRIISDTAAEDLPPAVLVGMKPDGGMALGAVLVSLARHPAQLPALIRTGRRAGIAFRELGRVHHVLARARIGRLDLGEFALDMR